MPGEWQERRGIQHAAERWAQIVRDRRNEQTLRALGYTILRYTREQLADEPGRIAAELAGLIRPERWAG